MSSSAGLSCSGSTGAFFLEKSQNLQRILPLHVYFSIGKETNGPLNSSGRPNEHGLNFLELVFRRLGRERNRSCAYAQIINS
jgi:hypothetical protein